MKGNRKLMCLYQFYRFRSSSEIKVILTGQIQLKCQSHQR